MRVVGKSLHWQNEVSQCGLLVNRGDHFVADLVEWWAALGGLPVSCRGESSGNFRPLSPGSQPSRVASILPTAEVSASQLQENNRRRSPGADIKKLVATKLGLKPLEVSFQSMFIFFS